MANINLISARRAERVRLAKVARGLTACLFVSGALGLGTAAFMGARLIVARQHIALAENELERLRPILQEIESAEGQRSALKPKLDTLTEAQKTTNRWVGMMEGLKRAVPQQTWLTNLSVEKAGADGAPTLKIDGITANQSRVGETMYRLTMQPEFYNKIDLRFTQSKPEQDSVEFELAAHVKQPELQAKAGDTDATKGK